jgi:hypothetical protein
VPASSANSEARAWRWQQILEHGVSASVSDIGDDALQRTGDGHTLW